MIPVLYLRLSCLLVTVMIASQSHANIDNFLSNKDNLGYLQVTCVTKYCSPSAAKIVFLDENGKAKLCTGSLIQMDTSSENRFILTNSHCVPDDLKKQKQSNCSNRMKIIFPALKQDKNYSYEVVSCNKVVIASELDKEKIRQKHKSKFNFNIRPDILKGDPAILHDYAILELKSVPNRPALVVNNQGLADGEVLSVTKSDPTSNGRSEMKSVECRSTYNSMLSPVREAQGYYYALTGCPIIGGNSGSTVLNEKGEAVALIYSYKKPEEKGIFGDIAVASNNSAVVNNLRCIPFDTLNEDNLPSDCFNYLTHSQLAYTRNIISTKAKSRFLMDIEAHLQSQTTSYQVKSGEIGLYMNSISTKDRLEKSYFADYGVQLVCASDEVEEKFSIESQNYRARTFLNEDFLLEYKIEQSTHKVKYKKLYEDPNFMYFFIETKHNKWQTPIPRCNKKLSDT